MILNLDFSLFWYLFFLVHLKIIKCLFLHCSAEIIAEWLRWFSHEQQKQENGSFHKRVARWSICVECDWGNLQSP